MNDLLIPRQALRDKWATVNEEGSRGNHSEPVPSPCVSVCRLDPGNRYCEGCLRSLAELREWRDANAQRRIAIWHEVIERLDACEQPSMS